MATLPELLAQHQDAHSRYSKLFAARQAVAKKLLEAQQARTLVRAGIHATVGPLAVGALVMTPNGTRFYEINSILDKYYHGTPIYQRSGECKIMESNSMWAYRAARPLECGSVIPVPRDHPIYLKWEKRRLRDKLEGKG